MQTQLQSGVISHDRATHKSFINHDQLFLISSPTLDSVGPGCLIWSTRTNYWLHSTSVYLSCRRKYKVWREDDFPSLLSRYPSKVGYACQIC